MPVRLFTRSAAVSRRRSLVAAGARILAACWLVACSTESARSGANSALPDDPSESPPPALHHVHLNSMDPEAAAAWYVDLWPAARDTVVDGRVGVAAEMLLLFDRVSRPPAGAFRPELGRPEEQSPIWHIGGFVNTTGRIEALDGAGATVLPLHVGPHGEAPVLRSGLAPYLGTLTAGELSAAPRVDPRDGGFAYLLGPDGALVELTGGPRTRPAFRHIHLFHERPLCAANWYVDHLGMAFPPVRSPDGTSTPGTRHEPCEAERGEAGWPSLERAGTIRQPRAAVQYDGGTLGWYPRQCTVERCGAERPLVGSAGQVFDHLAFTVPDLEGRLAYLRSRGVRVVEEPYDFAGGRAARIEGPDGLVIELVEPDSTP